MNYNPKLISKIANKKVFINDMDTFCVNGHPDNDCIAFIEALKLAELGLGCTRVSGNLSMGEIYVTVYECGYIDVKDLQSPDDDILKDSIEMEIKDFLGIFRDIHLDFYSRKLKELSKSNSEIAQKFEESERQRNTLMQLLSDKEPTVELALMLGIKCETFTTKDSIYDPWGGNKVTRYSGEAVIRYADGRVYKAHVPKPTNVKYSQMSYSSIEFVKLN
ncbi:hypothetical protein NHG76_16600 [Vibrio cholerae]|uniref:hypothetical protein n=1 Tax=Vibrio cholerae TaxID=666 RepID=UPI0035315DEE